MLTPIPNTIQVITCQEIDGETYITVDCFDFDHYKRLPAAVSHISGTLRKTGWNSDKHYAAYKTAEPGSLMNFYA
jgi:hypothetical protein